MGLICWFWGHKWKEVKREKQKIVDTTKEQVGEYTLPSGRRAPIFTIKKSEREIVKVHYECITCSKKRTETIEA